MTVSCTKSCIKIDLEKQIVLQVKKSEAGTGDPIFKQLPEPDAVPASRQLDLS